MKYFGWVSGVSVEVKELVFMRLDYFQDQEITLTLKLNGISNPNHRHNPEKAERVFCVSGFVCFLVYVE